LACSTGRPGPEAARRKSSGLGGVQYALGHRGQPQNGCSTHSTKPIAHLLGPMFFLRLHLYWTYIATKPAHDGRSGSAIILASD
jgi:hypothetical protein